MFRFAWILAAGLLTGMAATAGPRPAPECALWLQKATPDMQAWLSGYVSGIDVADGAQYGFPIQKKVASDSQLFAWATDYCRNHTDATLAHVGRALFTHLIAPGSTTGQPQTAPARPAD